MELTRPQLDRAVAAGVLSAAQADALWASLSATGDDGDRPAAAAPRRHLLALAAAVGACVACALAVVTAWDRLGPAAGCVLAAACAAALLRGGGRAARRSLDAAAAALLSGTIAAVGAAAYAVQRWIGLAPEGAAPDTLATWATSDDVLAAAAATVAGALLLWKHRAPFLAAAMVALTWLLAVDGAPIVFGPAPTWDQRALLSSLVGLLALGAGVVIDRRTRRDHSFWLYLAGLVALCGALASARSASSLALGAVVNGALVVVSLALRRRTFAVFGAIGLADVAGRIAADTLVEAAVPIAVLLLGAATAAAGLAYVRFERAWSGALLGSFPEPLRRLLPPTVARR